MADQVDPRLEADAQIARALQIVVDANEDDLPRGREYTPDELETLFFALGTAMVQLSKLPGGWEARERFYTNATDVLARRGRQDILDSLKKEHNRKVEAKEIIRRAFGDGIDFSIGTSGFVMLKMVELELDQTSELRAKLTTLAATLGR